MNKEILNIALKAIENKIQVCQQYIDTSYNTKSKITTMYKMKYKHYNELRSETIKQLKELKL